LNPRKTNKGFNYYNPDKIQQGSQKEIHKPNFIALTSIVLGSGITGTSPVEQLHENPKASEIAPRLTPEIMKGIDDAFGIKKREEED
jgi:hypothetical protein